MKTCLNCGEKKKGKYFPNSYHYNSRGQKCGGKSSICGLCIATKKLKDIAERKLNKLKK